MTQFNCQLEIETDHLAYNPNIHHRKSIRIKDYDYSQSGIYFITVCTQNRLRFFGQIADGEMQLNDAGKMIQKWYNELPKKFSDIKLDEHVVMPNHFHCIILNIGIKSVGADLRVCPDNLDDRRNELGEHTGSPLHTVVQWFKTMTTNEYIRNVKQNGWKSFNRKLWQRNYYEHVVRNENDLNRIRKYINDNPTNWGADDENK